MMWNHLKLFDKMTVDLNYDLFGENDPEIGPLGPIFNTPLKLVQVDMYVHQDWRETSGKFL